MRAFARALVAAVLAIAASGCDDKGKKNPEARDAGEVAAHVETVRWDPATRASAIEAGKGVLQKHQCTRCHVVDDVPAAARPLHCTSCHQFLESLKPGEKHYEELAKKYGEPIIQRYQRNIVHLVEVPDLTKIAKRVRPTFLATFLAEPEDLRPALEESMFRHRLSPDEIAKVVRYFAAVAEVADPATTHDEPAIGPANETRVAQGKKLFLERGCTACHTFGNLPTGTTAEQLRKAGVAAALAPNLRFAKERMLPETIVAWITNPQAISPGTKMPNLGLSKDDAEAIRDFLLHADPALEPAPALSEPKLPALLDRKVSYDEMKERVLGKVCVHCHMNDHEKDPGPGNQGGLGYAGVGLRMRTYETLVSGAVGDDGKRYSVLVPRPGEKVAPILEAMLRRRVEEARDRVEPFHDHVRPRYPKDKPGMPMGLPAMTDEETAILATWIAQGCVGPEKVTGMPGVDDGYLVPDGPIAKNKGCELRMPDAKRPSWAVDGGKAPSGASSGR